MSKKNQNKKEEEQLEEFVFVEENEPISETKVNHPPYIGFTFRLILSIVLVPILSLLAIYFLYHAFTVDDLVNIRYTEQGSITPNEEESTLDASYSFQVNEKSNLTFDYQLQGELIIEDKEENVLYQESIPLGEKEEHVLQNESESTYQKNVSFNTKEYVEKVHKYQESYDVETNNYIKVLLKINYHSNKNNSYYLVDESNVSIKIPIESSNKEIEYEKLDIEKRVDTKPKIKVQSTGLLGLGIMVSIGAVLSLTGALILVNSLVDQKSTYDKLVEKILKKYKNKIVEVSKLPKTRGKKIHDVYSIRQLAKVSKKENLPIKYCVIHEHSKCQFFVEIKKDLFVYIIKEVDIEKKD